jgi:hypothetical protein
MWEFIEYKGHRRNRYEVDPLGLHHVLHTANQLHGRELTKNFVTLESLDSLFNWNLLYVSRV